MMRRRPVLISAVAASPAVSGVARPPTLMENWESSTRAGNTAKLVTHTHCANGGSACDELRVSVCHQFNRSARVQLPLRSRTISALDE